MAQQIGDALVSAIEQVDISASSSSSEINLTDEEKQFLVDGDNRGEDIEITFYVIDEEFDSIENIENKVESLTENPVEKNVLDYEGNKGFISVDSVDIPDSSSTKNLKQGNISGKFLSFPRNFPNSSFIVLITSEANFDGEISGSLTVEKLLDSTVEGNLNSNADLTVEKLLKTNIDSYFVFSGGDRYSSGEYSSDLYGREFVPLSSERAIEAEINSSLEIKSGIYGYNYGNSYSSEEPVLSLVIPISASAGGELKAEGTLEDITEISYGYDYGSDYGGYMTGYGSNIYGRDTYEG